MLLRAGLRPLGVGAHLIHKGAHGVVHLPLTRGHVVDRLPQLRRHGAGGGLSGGAHALCHALECGDGGLQRAHRFRLQFLGLPNLSAKQLIQLVGKGGHLVLKSRADGLPLRPAKFAEALGDRFDGLLQTRAKFGAVPPCRFDLLFRQPLKDVPQLADEAIFQLLRVGYGLLGGGNEAAKIFLADASGI